MVEAQQNPLWLTLLTLTCGFLGGSVTGQTTEFARTKREREARVEARRLLLLDKRIELQRETLMEMQDALIHASERFVFLVKNRMGYEETIQQRLLGASEVQQHFLWRWSVLRSRLSKTELRKAAARFGNASATIEQIRATQKSSKELLEEFFTAFNNLNELIGQELRDLNAQEQST